MRDAAQRALVMKYLAELTAAGVKEQREQLAGLMMNGDRVGVPDPGGTGSELGIVVRSKPQPSAVVVDRVKFAGWMAEHYPGRVHTVVSLPEENLEAAIQVLHSSAPELLDEELMVEDWAESEVLACTVRAGEPCGPGGELDVPGVVFQPAGEGTVQVRLGADAPRMIEELWRTGRIDLVSGNVLELPEGDSGDSQNP